MLKRLSLVCLIFFISSVASAVPVTIEVFWPNWSTDNRVTLRNPSNVVLDTICDPVNCFNGTNDTAHAETRNYNLTAGNNYSIQLEDFFGDSWNGVGAYVRVTVDGVLAIDDSGPPSSTETLFFNVSAAPPTTGCSSNIVICSHSTSYGDINGTGATNLRAKLSNTALFGPTGSLTPETFSFVSIPSITATNLTSNNCQIYFSGYDTPTLIDATEQAALNTWVNGAANRFVMTGCDSTGFDATCQAVGRNVTNYTNVPVNLVAATPQNPLLCSGATTVQTSGGASGYFGTTTGDSILARYNDASALPEVITDSLTGGANYLLAGDINMWITPNTAISAGSGVSLANDFFIVNSFKFAADNVCGRIGASGPVCPGSVQPADYGDAPSSYGDPNHTIVSGVRIGAADPDSEALTQNTANGGTDGLGDDNTGSDDETITIPTLTQGQTATINIPVAGAGGLLQAWIDYDNGGTFGAGEQIATNVTDGGAGDADGLANGTIQLSVPIPLTATTASTYARFRWSTTSNLDATTAANNGEVEDYVITIIAPVLVNCGTEAAGSGSGYAAGGTGIYRDQIFWLDWSCSAAQFNPGDTISKSWTVGNGFIISATISNLTEIIVPYNTGNWIGDTLDDLYSGVNPIGLTNLIELPSGSAPDPTYDISFTATLNGIPIPADIVAAEAEDTSLSNESATWTTDGDPWQPLEAAGVLNAQFSNSNRTIFMNEISSAGGGTLIALSENVSTINVDMQAGGKEALAFGVFVPFDYGDANGFAASDGHYAGVAASGGSQPATLTPVTSLTMATVQYGTNLYLGTNAPDTESGDQPNVAANGDDNNGTDDEDGVVVPTLVAGATSDVTIPAADITGSGVGTLHAWIDFNGDGVFGTTEYATVGFNNGATGPLTFSAYGTTVAVGTTYARFRLTTDALTNVNAATVASNGEVEDYVITISAPPTTGCSSNIVICSHSTSYGDINGTGATNLRAKLSNTALFGPTGSLTPETFSFVSIPSITATNLTSNNCQIYFSGYDTPTLIDATEQAALNTWVNGAANRFVMTGCDSTGFDATCQAVGRNVTNYTNVPVNLVAATPQNPLLCSGATTVQTSGGASGYFGTTTGDSILARYNDASALPEVITDSLTGGANYLLAGDINMWITPNTAISAGSGVSLANDFFIVNSFKFAADNVCGRIGASGPVCPGSVQPADYGDAPSSYGDPNHTIVSGVRIGAADPDSEALTQNTANGGTDGLGDDNTGSDDETITIPTLTQGQTATINIPVAGAGGLLQAWIDYDNGGTFGAGEQIATNVTDGGAGDADGLANGTIQLSVPIPLTATTASTYARFRWSTTSNLDATTAANNGEVEDYVITIIALTLDPGGPVGDCVYVQNFDGNPPLYDAIPYYSLGNVATQNGFHITDTLSGTGATGIDMDASGAGLFLFHNTSPGALVGETWGTTTAASVTAGLQYKLTFKLANQNAVNREQIEPFINGVSVGSSVTTSTINNWETFTFNWNSGVATTADISLINNNAASTGNDFGIDEVSLCAPTADLVITKDDGNATYTPGGTASYTIVVTNNGPDNVTGATIADDLPDGVTMTANWTCAPSSVNSSCNTTPSTTDPISIDVDIVNGDSITVTVPVQFSSDMTDY